MPLSGSYHYPVTQKPNSSYPSVDMREVDIAPAGSTGLGKFFVSGSEAYFVDESGQIKPLSLGVLGSLTDTVTPTGTTQTIDFSTGLSHVIDLESATGDVTLTLSNPRAGESYIVKVIQGSTTPRNLVWPAAVLWPDGITPTISTGANAEDVVSLWYDGTNFYATIGQNFS